MSEGDFDIDGLAEFLHLMPQQVQRMAERGRIPGRKVSGQWRFSRPEIHHWLEERIGAADDDDELAKMEDVLQRKAGSNTSATSVVELLSIDAIAIPLAAKTRGAVIDAMTRLAADTGLLWDPAKMADAVRAREEMYPTAVPGGIALMHPRRPMPNIIAEPFLALGRTTQGIPFGGDHGQLTDIFFLICSVTDHGHLQTLARLSRLIKDPSLLQQIRAAEDASAVHELLVACEVRLES